MLMLTAQKLLCSWWPERQMQICDLLLSRELISLLRAHHTIKIYFDYSFITFHPYMCMGLNPFIVSYFQPFQKKTTTKNPITQINLLCVGVSNHLVFCCRGLSCTAEPCSYPGWCGPHGWAGFQQTRLERRQAVYSAPAAAASTWWREWAKLCISLRSTSRQDSWQQYSLPFIWYVNVGAKFDVL